MGKKPHKNTNDDCGALIKNFSFVCVITWLAALVSWFVAGEMPELLVRGVFAAYGFCYAAYCCKTAYERKVKDEHESDGSESGASP